MSIKQEKYRVLCQTMSERHTSEYRRITRFWVKNKMMTSFFEHVKFWSISGKYSWRYLEGIWRYRFGAQSKIWVANIKRKFIQMVIEVIGLHEVT